MQLGQELALLFHQGLRSPVDVSLQAGEKAVPAPGPEPVMDLCRSLLLAPQPIFLCITAWETMRSCLQRPGAPRYRRGL